MAASCASAILRTGGAVAQAMHCEFVPKRRLSADSFLNVWPRSARAIFSNQIDLAPSRPASGTNSAPSRLSSESPAGPPDDRLANSLRRRAYNVAHVDSWLKVTRDVANAWPVRRFGSIRTRA